MNEDEKEYLGANPCPAEVFFSILFIFFKLKFIEIARSSFWKIHISQIKLFAWLSTLTLVLLIFFPIFMNSFQIGNAISTFKRRKLFQIADKNIQVDNAISSFKRRKMLIKNTSNWERNYQLQATIF